MSWGRQRALVVLVVAAAAGIAATLRAAAFVPVRPCGQVASRAAAAQLDGRAAACPGADAQRGGAAPVCAVASAAAFCALAVAAAARLGSRPSAGKRTHGAIVRQAAFDAPETVPDLLPRARFSFAGASAPVPFNSAGRQISVKRHLLMPKQIVWRKPHKPSVKPFHHSAKWKFRGFETEGVKPHFGKYALQALEEAWMTSKQIEECRRVITRTFERKGKVFIRVVPDHAITRRVAESRMGAGKGNISYWVAVVRPQKILFECDGVPEKLVIEAYRRIGYILGFKARMIKKEDGPSEYQLQEAGGAVEKRDFKDFAADDLLKNFKQRMR